MAYETGTASSVNDLLGKIRDFALSNGWTVNAFGARSDGGGAGGLCLNVQKGDLHFALFSDLSSTNTSTGLGNFLGGYMYPSYTSSNPNMSQANKSQNIVGNGLGTTELDAYHFFADGDCVHIVVETDPGIYKHFGFGRLLRFGNVTTGGYLFVSIQESHGSGVSHISVPFYHGVSVSRPATVVRADDGGINYYYTGAFSPSLVCGFASGFESDLVRNGVSTITGRAPLIPIIVAARRGQASPVMYSFVGQVNGMRWVRLDNLAPGQVLTLGHDQWQVFPLIRKNGAIGEPNSGVHGIAYKR